MHLFRSKTCLKNEAIESLRGSSWYFRLSRSFLMKQKHKEVRPFGCCLQATRLVKRSWSCVQDMTIYVLQKLWPWPREVRRRASKA